MNEGQAVTGFSLIERRVQLRLCNDPSSPIPESAIHLHSGVASHRGNEAPSRPPAQHVVPLLLVSATNPKPTRLDSKGARSKGTSAGRGERVGGEHLPSAVQLMPRKKSRGGH